MSQVGGSSALRLGLLFIAAIVIGCLLGGVLTVLHQATFGESDFRLSVALMIGGTYVLFATVPAIVFGVPAILYLRRIGATRLSATTALTAGGGSVGWLLITVTFTGMETWGGLAGASVGFMSGVLIFPRHRMEAANG